MTDSKEKETPMITAIRLARMRDGNMGQSDEIQSLLDLLKGSEKVMKIVNDVVWSMMQKKKGMSSGYRKQLFDEAFVTLVDATEKFVDAKTKRIEKFLNYFMLMNQDVSEETQRLREFEKEWETILRDFSDFRAKFSFDKTDDAIEQTNYLKNNVLQTSIPILEKLTQMENTMQKRTLGLIAFIAKETQPVNPNELYKLLTAEP